VRERIAGSNANQLKALHTDCFLDPLFSITLFQRVAVSSAREPVGES
jgi:hypothetical protein